MWKQYTVPKEWVQENAKSNLRLAAICVLLDCFSDCFDGRIMLAISMPCNFCARIMKENILWHNRYLRKSYCRGLVCGRFLCANVFGKITRYGICQLESLKRGRTGSDAAILNMTSKKDGSGRRQHKGIWWCDDAQYNIQPRGRSNVWCVRSSCGTI